MIFQYNKNETRTLFIPKFEIREQSVEFRIEHENAIISNHLIFYY